MGDASSPGPSDEIVTKTTSLGVDELVAKLREIIEGRGLSIFGVIDHSAAARAVGLELRETRVVIFGSPAAGTPVMQAVPLIALELPLKILVWDDRGTTSVSYLSPDALARRHGLEGELASRLAGIASVVADAVTD